MSESRFSSYSVLHFTMISAMMYDSVFQLPFSSMCLISVLYLHSISIQRRRKSMKRKGKAIQKVIQLAEMDTDGIRILFESQFHCHKHNINQQMSNEDQIFQALRLRKKAKKVKHRKTHEENMENRLDTYKHSECISFLCFYSLSLSLSLSA